MTTLKVRKISVVLPVRDEVETLPSLHQELLQVLVLHEPYEIIYVDDGSSDGSFEYLVRLAESDPHVKLASFLRPAGKSAAISVGFQRADGDILITMDSDGQDDPSDIPRLLEAMESTNLDLVSGWKVCRKDSFPKRFWSKVFNRVIQTLFKVRIHDVNCGFKVYRRRVAEDISLYGDLHRFIPVLAAWSGYAVGEVPVHHRPRAHGRSKYGVSRLFSAPLDLISVIFLTHFLVRPLHLFGAIGIASGGLGFAICLYLTLGWIAHFWHINDRPLILLGVMLVILGVQMLSLGLVSEMTMRASQGRIRTCPALRADWPKREDRSGQTQEEPPEAP